MTDTNAENGLDATGRLQNFSFVVIAEKVAQLAEEIKTDRQAQQ